MHGLSIDCHKRKSGFAIISILGIIALMSIALINLVQFFSIYNSLTSKRYTKFYYLNFLSNMRRELEDPFTCPVTLQNQVLGGANPGSWNKAVLLNSPSIGSPVAAGWISPTNVFKVTSIKMLTINRKTWTTTSSTSNRIVKFDRPFPILDSYLVRLFLKPSAIGNYSMIDLNMSDAEAGVLSPKHPEYVIDLIVNVDPLKGNKIEACHGLKSIASVCEDSGGAYDSTSAMNANPELRCHPNYRCWTGPLGILTTTPTPSATIPLAVPPTNCLWPYSRAEWIGRISGVDKWLCSWCNDGIWP